MTPRQTAEAPVLHLDQVRPPFGYINDVGAWFDGENFRTPRPETDAYRFAEKMAMYAVGGRHFDGCFTCPRCRMHHYMPDTYDGLCDACAPYAGDANAVDQCRDRARRHWLGAEDPQIAAKVQFREAYAKARAELYPKPERYFVSRIDAVGNIITGDLGRFL